MALCALGIWIIGFFHKAGTPYSKFENLLIKEFCKWSSRLVILTMSGLKITENRPKVDYKKYLGEDWKASYDNPGSIVSNHQAWLDIMMHMNRQPPSHVAKASIKKVPFIGYIADYCGCLFIDRGSKDQKKDMITQISER